MKGMNIDMKIARKAIAIGVAIVMAVTSAIPPIFAQMDSVESSGNVREENGWLLRDHGANSYQTDASGTLTSGNSTYGCAGAYWKLPAGKKMFTATFDIDWADTNPVEGGAHYDWFLKIGMTKDPTFPDGTDVYPIQSAFRLKTNHIDLDPGSDPDQDYYVPGSATDLVGFNMKDADTVRGMLTLKDGELTLTIETANGSTVNNTQSRSFSYKDTYFDGSDLYIAFVNNGEMRFSIRNFQVVETDIEAQWIQNKVDKPYTVEGNSLLAENAVSNDAAAYYAAPVGMEEFKASFDIGWNDDNGNVSNEANRILMFLSKNTTYFSGEGNWNNVPDNSVIVNNQHVDVPVRSSDVESASGITDGGADCGNSWALTGNGPIHVTAELKNRRLTVTLTSSVNGSLLKIGWVQYEASYLDKQPLYFGFKDMGGQLKYSIRNFTIEETDIVSEEDRAGWDIREIGGPFTTNENNDLLGMSAWGYAGAFWSAPIGHTGFKVTFDMEWTNADTGSDDWFARLGLVKEASYPKELGDSAFYDIKNSIRLKSNKLIISEDGDMDANYYVEGSAKVSVDEGIDLSAADSVKAEYSLVNRVVTLTVTATTGSTVKKMSASFEYKEEFFDGSGLYIGVMNHAGLLGYNITNLQFVEMDGCVIDGDWYQRPIDSPYVTDGSSLLTMGDGVTVGENAGAIYQKPLGYSEFKAEFDLEVPQGLPNEGEPAYDGNRLAVFLTKTFGFQEGSGSYFPTNSFVIRNKHIETASFDSNIAQAGAITDGGGWLLDANSPIHAVVQMADKKLTLTLTSANGTQTKTQYFVYNADYFDKTPFYIGFLRIGSFQHNIKNLKITETDLNSVSEENYVDENGWRIRIGDNLSPYSTDADQNLLGTASGSGAAAFRLGGVGYNKFKASFDLEWDASNLEQNAESYWDNFLAVAISKDAAFLKGNAPEVPLGSFRVTTNHLQAATADMDTANLVQSSNTEIIEGLNLKGKTVKVTVELSYRLFTLTVTLPDGEALTASYKLTSSFFKNKPLYIGFFQNGAVKMNVRNFELLESDLESGGETEEIPLPEGYTNDFSDSIWIARTGEGIKQFATNSKGSLYAYGNDNVNGAVWWSQKLPSKNFQVTFDLDWAADNRMEGQNNYLDSFLSINLSKSPTFAEGTDPIAPKGRFRVTTNHIQAVRDDMDLDYLLPDEVFTPIVGGMNLADGPISCTLMVDEEGVVWLTFEQAGVEPMEAAYTYSWEFYADDAPLYLGFSNNGDMMYQISNIKYEQLAVEEYKYFTGYVGGYFEKVYGEFKDDYTKYLD